MAFNSPEPSDDIYTRRESSVRSYCRVFPTSFASAKNATLIGEDGNRYLDFLAGCSTLNYGHNHPGLKAALIDYIESDGIAHGLDMHTSAKSHFLAAFEKLILEPRNLDYRVMFPGPTGANAVEAALKLARKVTGRQNVIAFTNGFHGMTLGALACTGNSAKRAGAGIDIGGVSHEAFDGYFGKEVDTAEQLDTRLSDPSSGVDAPAAVLVEVVQGEGGLNVASDEWLRKIAKVAKKHGALLIIDDIQAGCGRTGPFFSFEHAGVTPDMVTLAKSLSGMGLPFALTLINPKYDDWQPGEHNGTFRGNNHAFVTAAKSLELFWKNDAFQNEVEAKGAHLRRRLADIANSFSGKTSLRGRGMMQGIAFEDGAIAAKICERCFEAGLIIETSGAFDEVVKVLSPLTITAEELDAGLNIVASSVAAEDALRQRKAA